MLASVRSVVVVSRHKFMLTSCWNACKLGSKSEPPSQQLASNDNDFAAAAATSLQELKPESFRIDRSKVPELREADLEEQFVSGSGPGGQSVNKSVNCCFIKHKPTGLSVKVHQQRSLIKNRQIARELLTNKLDQLINGEQSVESQKKRIALYRAAVKKVQQERRQANKEEYKKKNCDEPKQQHSARTRSDVDTSISSNW